MKRTKEDAEQTKQSILLAALKMFSSKGYSRTTLADVAREAGVTRGAVYWHFRDKLDLFRSLCFKAHQRLWKRNQEIFQQFPDPESRIRYSIINTLTVMEEDRQSYEIYEMITYRTELAEVIQLKQEGAEYFDKIFRVYREEIQKGIRAGIFPENTNAEKATFYLFATISGLREVWMLFQQEFSLKGMAEYVAELILGGIKNPHKENTCENNG